MGSWLMSMTDLLSNSNAFIHKQQTQLIHKLLRTRTHRGRRVGGELDAEHAVLLGPSGELEGPLAGRRGREREALGLGPTGVLLRVVL